MLKAIIFKANIIVIRNIYPLNNNYSNSSSSNNSSKNNNNRPLRTNKLRIWRLERSPSNRIIRYWTLCNSLISNHLCKTHKLYKICKVYTLKNLRNSKKKKSRNGIKWKFSFNNLLIKIIIIMRVIVRIVIITLNLAIIIVN